MASEFSIDFTDEKTHKGRLVVDKGLGFSHKTFVGTGSGVNGAPVDGRPMGRTAYFSASSDGTITYPVNHFVNFPTSKEGLSRLTYEGSVMGEEITTVNKYTNDLEPTIYDADDPLYLSQGETFINKGLSGDNVIVSASSFAVYVNNVGGSDTDTVLKVIRNT